MASSLCLRYSALSFFVGALSLLISGVNAKAISSVIPADILPNNTVNDTETTAEAVTRTAANISRFPDFPANHRSADRSTGESKSLDLTRPLVETTETVPIPSKLSSNITRAPEAVTRELKPFKLSSVTQIHDKSAHLSLDDPININLDVSTGDRSISKSNATFVESRRDLQDMVGIIPTLEDVQSKVNSALEGICSRLRPGQHIPRGLTCMAWAEFRGRDSLPCNGDITRTVTADVDKQSRVANAVTVLRDLEKVLQTVVLQYQLLAGNTSRCTVVQPLSNDHFRCLVASAKRNLQSAINILLKGIDESEVQPVNNLTCFPNQALGEKFPLGVLWRVNRELNLVITNVRRVCTLTC